MAHSKQKPADAALAPEVVRLLEGRPILIVGMMGAGKTTVGRRIAGRLNLAFTDSDAEIEAAARMTIPEIFASRGEPEFRAGEARVLARLIREHHGVVATGGGAFMNTETRELARAEAVTLWLRADLDTLFTRVSKRANRPLLKTEDPKGTLAALMEARNPTYAEADVILDSRDVPHDVVASEAILRIHDFLTRSPQ